MKEFLFVIETDRTPFPSIESHHMLVDSRTSFIHNLHFDRSEAKAEWNMRWRDFQVPRLNAEYCGLREAQWTSINSGKAQRSWPTPRDIYLLRVPFESHFSISFHIYILSKSRSSYSIKSPSPQWEGKRQFIHGPTESCLICLTQGIRTEIFFSPLSSRL